MNIEKIIDEVRVYLPIQFPLGVFIHNNMLFNFESKSFDQGTTEASKVFGASLTLDESYYFNKYKEGKITDLYLKPEIEKYILENNITENICGIKTKELFYSLMLNPFKVPHSVNFERNVVSSQFEIIFDLAKKINVVHEPHHSQIISKSWKNNFKADYQEDVDGYFWPLIIRFISGYLDQGMAVWANPHKEIGLLYSFKEFIASNNGMMDECFKNLKNDLDLIYNDNSVSALENTLKQIHYQTANLEFLTISALELRGWAGMVQKFEKEPYLIPRFVSKINIYDYLTIYLLLEKQVVDFLLKKHSLNGVPAVKHHFLEVDLTSEQKAYILDKIFILFPKVNLNFFSFEELNTLINVVLEFDLFHQSMIWHKALDYNVRNHFLNTIFSFNKNKQERKNTYKAQFLFCIDDREESIRRHVEESNPLYETFGVVGFFGLDMKFRSIHHPEAKDFCPPVVTPSKTICETHLEDGERGDNNISNYGKNLLNFFYHSRGSIGALFFTFVSGPLTTIILMLRVFFPHLALKFSHTFRKILIGDRLTEINFQSINNEKSEHGYTTSEMASIVSTILKMSGLTKNFSKYIFIIGHGSTSSNNPFKMAYGCGACGGKAGIPNSIIFCKMANMIEVREILKSSFYIEVPKDTYFISTYHDTSSDLINIYNETIIFSQDKIEFREIVFDLVQAAKKNSLERCRHFEKAKGIKTPNEAFKHVNNRAHSLAEPRPEYGHTNNAFCIIGRRELSKELYLDRRSFLTSYDQSIDLDGEILKVVMGGAVPVAGGINLDYYFARVDNEKFGSGTKLPLNISSLLGVMTGGCSDLRIGLAHQMVELHEPVRITILIESSNDFVLKAIDTNQRIKKMVTNSWIHLATIDPITKEIAIFHNNEFIKYDPININLSEVKSSLEYVQEKSGPLPYVRVRAV